jgi:hypothetical protein
LTKIENFGPKILIYFYTSRRVGLTLSVVATIVISIKNLRERRNKMEKKITVDMLGVARDADGYCVECAYEYCECL